MKREMICPSNKCIFCENSYRDYNKVKPFWTQVCRLNGLIVTFGEGCEQYLLNKNYEGDYEKEKEKDKQRGTATNSSKHSKV